jgi:hypothetical protein
MSAHMEPLQAHQQLRQRRPAWPADPGVDRRRVLYLAAAVEPEVSEADEQAMPPGAVPPGAVPAGDGPGAGPAQPGSTPDPLAGLQAERDAADAERLRQVFEQAALRQLADFVELEHRLRVPSLAGNLDLGDGEYITLAVIKAAALIALNFVPGFSDLRVVDNLMKAMLLPRLLEDVEGSIGLPLVRLHGGVSLDTRRGTSGMAGDGLAELLQRPQVKVVRSGGPEDPPVAPAGPVPVAPVVPVEPTAPVVPVVPTDPVGQAGTGTEPDEPSLVPVPPSGWSVSSGWTSPPAWAEPTATPAPAGWTQPPATPAPAGWTQPPATDTSAGWTPEPDAGPGGAELPGEPSAAPAPPGPWGCGGASIDSSGGYAAVIHGPAAAMANGSPYVSVDAIASYARKEAFRQVWDSAPDRAAAGVRTARSLEIVLLIDPQLGGGLWIDIDPATGHPASAFAIELAGPGAQAGTFRVTTLPAPESGGLGDGPAGEVGHVLSAELA